MKIQFTTTTHFLLPLLAALALVPAAAHAADWFTVTSNDKKVSVMFPHDAKQFDTMSTKTPAGAVKTEVVKHSQDGIMLTISDSAIPGIAMMFAGKDTILKNGAAGVVNSAFGKEISSEKTTIDGAPGLVLRYESADFNNPDHPGYSGLAVLFVVDKHLYTINSMLTKENADTKATQERLLNSIKVAK